jgi:hypothetical protein
VQTSVVVGEVPPYAIVGGSPAKVLKFRFSQTRIDELEALKWWDWSLEKLKQMQHLFETPPKQPRGCFRKSTLV